MRYLTCMLILVLCLTGCEAGKDSSVLKDKDKNAPNVPGAVAAPNTLTSITLTPVELFKGEGAKFKHFLGETSGAFKLRYEGEKPKVSLDIDVWKDGKKLRNSGSIIDLFFSSGELKENEIEIIISAEKISMDEQKDNDLYKIKVGTVYESGSNLYTFTTPWDKKLSASGLMQYSEPMTFTTAQPVHIWGMQTTSTNKIYTLSLSPESMSQIEQALIFTLRVEDGV